MKWRICRRRRRVYVVQPTPHRADTVRHCRRLLIAMLWTQALAAATVLLTIVLASDEIIEKIDVDSPEIVPGADDVIQERKDSPQRKSGGGQESSPPLNHLLPHRAQQRHKEVQHVYKTSNQILHQTYEVAPDPHHYEAGGYHDGGHVILEEEEEAGGYRGSAEDHQNSLFQGFPSLPHSEPWPLPAPDMPKILHLDVKCEKNLMKVSIEFDKPFHGTVFSKGHYAQGGCVHLPPGSGHTSVYFDVSINSCGTHGSSPGGYGQGSASAGNYFENTIVVQYDPQVQEVWDQARRLRCTWHDQYEKAVTFRPFPVDMLNVVRADFAGDNVGCWMQIQVGKGPWASEVSGIVKIGQTMTMVLAIKDEENKFDMMVRNCVAHDRARAPIELVDARGCVVRPKLMSRFTKVKNFGSSASVLAFAHFQAFKFPDSMDVHFQCTIQICRPHCPEQCAGQHDLYSAGLARHERDVSAGRNGSAVDVTEIGLDRVIRVVASGDLAFSDAPPDVGGRPEAVEKDDVICMSTPGFAASLVVLLLVLVVSCLVAAFLCLRQKSPRDIITSISGTVVKKTKP